MKVKNKIKELAIREGIHFNQALILVASERAIQRLTQSKILLEGLFYKGGLVMRIVHDSPRFTKDIDASFLSLSPDKIKNEAEKCLLTDLEDDFEFKNIKWGKIQESHLYEGLRLVSEIFFQKQKVQPLQIDFTLSETAIGYEKSKEIDIENMVNVYSKELILSEKIQTLISRRDKNGRGKDIFDINLLFLNGRIDVELFKKLLRDVFDKRKTILPKSFENEISSFDNSSLKNSWNGLLIPEKYKQDFDQSWKELVNNMKKVDMILENNGE